MEKVRFYRLGDMARSALLSIWPKGPRADRAFLQLKYFFVYRRFITARSDPFMHALLDLNSNPDRLGRVTLADKFALKKYAAARDVPAAPTVLTLPTPGPADHAHLIEAIGDGKLILKGSAASGANTIVDRTLSHEDYARLHAHATRSMYPRSREIVYRDLDPVVFAEPVLPDVRDLKVYCFHGEPALIQRIDFSKPERTMRFFEFDAPHRELQLNAGYPTDDDHPGFSTEEVEEMRRLIARLEIREPFLRVDFLFSDGRAYLGEMTFFPWGFARCVEPPEMNAALGEGVRTGWRLDPSLLLDG